jgi:hypothetical protein
MVFKTNHNVSRLYVLDSFDLRIFAVPFYYRIHMDRAFNMDTVHDLFGGVSVSDSEINTPINATS